MNVEFCGRNELQPPTVVVVVVGVGVVIVCDVSATYWGGGKGGIGRSGKGFEERQGCGESSGRWYRLGEEPLRSSLNCSTAGGHWADTNRWIECCHIRPLLSWTHPTIRPAYF